METQMQSIFQDEKRDLKKKMNEFDEFKEKWEWQNMHKRFQNILDDRIKCSGTKNDLLNYLNRF